MPVKVCPFCMVDARTDAAHCEYCGSRYDRVSPVATPRNDDTTMIAEPFADFSSGYIQREIDRRETKAD